MMILQKEEEEVEAEEEEQEEEQEEEEGEVNIDMEILKLMEVKETFEVEIISKMILLKI